MQTMSAKFLISNWSSQGKFSEIENSEFKMGLKVCLKLPLSQRATEGHFREKK